MTRENVYTGLCCRHALRNSNLGRILSPIIRYTHIHGLSLSLNTHVIFWLTVFARHDHVFALHRCIKYTFHTQSSSTLRHFTNVTSLSASQVPSLLDLSVSLWTESLVVSFHDVPLTWRLPIKYAKSKLLSSPGTLGIYGGQFFLF